MFQHTRRQVELFEMHWFSMFFTALQLCVIFLMKLRWPKNKSLYNTLFSSVLRHTAENTWRGQNVPDFWRWNEWD